MRTSCLGCGWQCLKEAEKFDTKGEGESTRHAICHNLAGRGLMVGALVSVPWGAGLRALNAVALKQFSIPGEQGFTLSGVFAAPANVAEAGGSAEWGGRPRVGDHGRRWGGASGRWGCSSRYQH
jgi:hypothetical protein